MFLVLDLWTAEMTTASPQLPPPHPAQSSSLPETSNYWKKRHLKKHSEMKKVWQSCHNNPSWREGDPAACWERWIEVLTPVELAMREPIFSKNAQVCQRRACCRSLHCNFSSVHQNCRMKQYIFVNARLFKKWMWYTKTRISPKIRMSTELLYTLPWCFSNSTLIG